MYMKTDYTTITMRTTDITCRVHDRPCEQLIYVYYGRCEQLKYVCVQLRYVDLYNGTT